MEPRDLALVFLSSMAPSFEGRYALLAGIALGLDPLVSLAIASLGVSLVAVVLALIMPLIDSWARHTSLGVVRGLYQRIVLRARRKAGKYIRYGLPGLIAFVAVPLPGTGVWTGALVAFLFGLPRRTTLAGLVAGGLLSNLVTFSLYLATGRVLGA